MRMMENDASAEASRKLFWMVDYCRKMGWSICDSYFWSKAEQEYLKEKQNETNS